MSVSPAFMPGAGHPAPEPFGYRPLAAIAAAAAGGVPQKRIGRVMSEIAPELMAAHEQGKVHGAISVHTVGLDEFGYAHVMVPALYPDHPGSMEPASCFAAAEQFDADPVQSSGPWTDVYALCAVMCSLVSGSPPPHALARKANDEYVPLAARLPRGYDEAFLAVIDQGLSLAPAQRPQSVAALCGLLGISCVPETQEDPSAKSSGAGTPPAASHVHGQWRGGERRRLGRVAAMLAGVLAVVLIWAWMNQDDIAEDIRPGPVVALPRASSGRAMTPPFPTRDTAGPDAGGTAAADPDTGLDTDDAGRSPDPQSLTAAPSGPAAPLSAPSAPAEPAIPSLSSTGQPAVTAAPERAARPASVAVKVNVEPWGEIFVDGVSRGISPPLKTLNLAPGRHAVEVRNAGLTPYRVTVDLKPGQPAAIRHTFN